MVMMHRQQQQQHVSFNRHIRVRKHIHRSSISKEEMASTWYTTKEIYETKTILKQKQKFKRFLRDENKRSKLHEDRKKVDNNKLLSAALQTVEQTTTTKWSLEECSVNTLDTSLHNFEKQRQKRPPSTHLQRSNSMRRLKVKGSPSSKPDRRKLLKKSNSLPSIIQDENVPNRNYDDGTILGRQRSFRLKTRIDKNSNGNGSSSRSLDISGFRESSPRLTTQRSFRLKKRIDKNSNGRGSSTRSLDISGFRESSPRLTTKRKSKSYRSLSKQSFVLDEEEPPLDYAL